MWFSYENNIVSRPPRSTQLYLYEIVFIFFKQSFDIDTLLFLSYLPILLQVSCDDENIPHLSITDVIFYTHTRSFILSFQFVFLTRFCF